MGSDISIKVRSFACYKYQIAKLCRSRKQWDILIILYYVEDFLFNSGIGFCMSCHAYSCKGCNRGKHLF